MIGPLFECTLTEVLSMLVMWVSRKSWLMFFLTRMAVAPPCLCSLSVQCVV